MKQGYNIKNEDSLQKNGATQRSIDKLTVLTSNPIHKRSRNHPGDLSNPGSNNYHSLTLDEQNS